MGWLHAGSRAIQTDSDNLEQLVHDRVLRLNAVVHGVAVGTVAGLGLFVATNWLLIKGGPHVGQHLSLLNQFFPGYRVSFVGSLIGFAWAFAAGFITTWLLATIYNWVVDRRHAGRT